MTAVVLVYDVKRAVAPRLAGEQRWRRGRAVATTAAIIAFAFLQRTAGPLWVKRVALIGFILACAAVLRCSVPLKRLVTDALRKRPD